MTKKELEQIRILVEQANKASAEGMESRHDKNCKVRWRRRLIVMIGLFGVMYGIQIWTHHELAEQAVHLTLEGGVALAVERLWSILA